MKSQIILLLTGLLTLPIISLACDCSLIKNLRETQELSLEYSQLIFIAEILSIDTKDDSNHYNDNYEVIVKEAFKGNIKINEVLKGKASTSCSILPEKGLWLIYAMVDEQGTIEFFSCGLSRSFDKPHYIFYPPYTPEPPTKEEAESVDFQLQAAIDYAAKKQQAAQDLKDEIEWLRTKSGKPAHNKY